MALKIGEVAERGGVNLQTIRYYEREGLLPEPPRLASGYRMFPDRSVRRVRFIKRAQDLGFTLAEIKELLSLRIDAKRNSAEVRSLAQAKIADIEEKIRTLRGMKRVLSELTERCSGCGPSSECPILESIDSEEVHAMTWRRAAAFLPGVGIALLPKLTCPMCWPAYAALLTTIGLSFLVSARYLFGVTSVFLLIWVAALAYRARERRGYSPAVAGVLAAVAVLIGKFHFDSTAATYAGLGLLIAASVWNSWPCPACAPTGSEFIQLSAKGR
jgi:MerR family transcriptional regulator, copper efflux regulator